VSNSEENLLSSVYLHTTRMQCTHKEEAQESNASLELSDYYKELCTNWYSGHKEHPMIRT